MKKQQRESTKWEGDPEHMLNICIQAYQGALEATTNSMNRRIDELTLRHASDIQELKITHAKDLISLEAKFSKELERLGMSLQFTQVSRDDLKKKLSTPSREQQSTAETEDLAVINQ